MFLSYQVLSTKHIVEHSSELLLAPLNVGTARREDSPSGMLLPAPTERNIRQSYTPDVVPAKPSLTEIAKTPRDDIRFSDKKS